MKKTIFLALATLLTFCSTPTKKSMTISGQIDGLRKGQLFLQKMEDTLLVDVDSIAISGENTFTLGDDIIDPEFYLLTLKMDDSLFEKILFFGEKGDITINTRLKTFTSSAEIEGSENQELWEEYESIMRKFNNQNLTNYENFLKDQEEMTDAERNAKWEATNKNFVKRKYLFALNFAMNNADKEVAAYIGRFEVNNAAPLFLDSLYNQLSDEVKKSKYGKLFQEELVRIKESAE